MAGALNVGNNGTFNEVQGGAGNDNITGNDNTRIAFYDALDGVTVNLGTGNSQGTAGGDLAKVGTDTFTDVSAVAGSAFNDAITGSNNAAIRRRNSAAAPATIVLMALADSTELTTRMMLRPLQVSMSIWLWAMFPVTRRSAWTH